jgi:phage I-like protein
VPRGFAKLAIEFGPEGALPDRFRLFVPGWNTTENGDFLFDEAAAAAVMAAYQTWGVDLAIDLEHQMLAPGIAPDPTAKDARGWCQLELAADGSLWAVNVRWTPDGAARLTEKRQRYVSPAFEIDPESQRVTKIVNVAITAIPATHKTPALVAASLKRLSMDPKLVQQALDALIEGDADKCAELLKGAIAAAASTEAPAAEPAPEASAAPMAEEPKPAEEAAAAPPAPPVEGEEEKDEEEKAAVVAASKLVALSGKASLIDALSEVEEWRKSHVELETKRQEIAREKAALESAERVRLCKELVACGAEFPSTVWTDEKSTALRGEWLEIKIETLRNKVAAQKAARASKKTPTAPKQNAEDGGKQFTTPHGVVTLSARELAVCADAKADPQVYANNKAFQDHARKNAGR